MSRPLVIKATEKIKRASPEIVKKVNKMIGTLERMTQQSAAHMNYDESGPTKVLQKGLAMMQTLINRRSLRLLLAQRARACWSSITSSLRCAS